MIDNKREIDFIAEDIKELFDEYDHYKYQAEYYKTKYEEMVEKYES